MVDTITPVVHGHSRARWRISVAMHTLGATLSAAALGGLLGATGLALRAPWDAGGLLLIAGFAVLYAAHETLGLRVPIPQGRRQVPVWWRTFFSPNVASFLYGLGLGVGFLTYQSFGTLTVVALGAFASGDPALGAVMVVPFGLARGLSVAVAGGAEPGGDGETVADRLASLARTRLPKAVNGLALAAVALVALAAAGSRDGVELADLGAACLAFVSAGPRSAR